MSSNANNNISPDDIVWRTPLLHPPKSQVEAELIQHSGGKVDPQVGARCLEMAGGAALEWRVVVSERTIPDGKQEVRIRNPKLSSAISQPLLPPMALDSATTSPGIVTTTLGGGGGPRVHYQSACLSLCVVPDLHTPQKTALWCGWSSGHISVHQIGGRNAGEVLECFVAHRGGGPVRMLKSLSCEKYSNHPSSNSSNSAESALIESSEKGVEATLTRLVISASSDFAVTLWDSQSMRPIKSVQLGAAIGIVRAICVDKFTVYNNEASSTPLLSKMSLCIVGADNGALSVLDLRKEVLGAEETNGMNNNNNNGSATSPTSPRGPRTTQVNLLNQRASVTAIAAVHFDGAAPSVCVSGSEGGVLRAQSIATGLSSGASGSTTLSLQHGAVNSIAVLPTSSLPMRVSGGGGSNSGGGGQLILVACASGRIFILMLGAGPVPQDRPNNNDIAPMLSALASFVSPTGTVVQLCSRPAWSRAVYAVTSSGAVDLYSSTEAMLSKISIPASSSRTLAADETASSGASSYIVAPSQLKAKTISLIMQAERRYEHNLQLMLDLASESKRHCEGRDGALLRLQDEGNEKGRLLDAMTEQCEVLTARVEELRAENSRLSTERSAIMDHASAAATGGSHARHEADIMARELKAAQEREMNSTALMDALRLRVITLERELDRSLAAMRHLEADANSERRRANELQEQLLRSRSTASQQRPLLEGALDAHADHGNGNNNSAVVL